MDSISNLFRINLITSCSESTTSKCDLNALLKNYDSINDLNGITFRDLSTNTAHPINNLRLRISNIEEIKSRPDQNVLQKVLHDVVAEESNKYELANTIELIDTPWFERWKDEFISYHNVYNHDFIGANLGVFIIVSTADLDNFDGIVSTLLGQVRDCSLLRFMTNGFIEHYVVVDFIKDNCGTVPELPNTDTNPANPKYERFVNCFGANNCSWLTIPESQPGQNIIPFLKKFVSNSLMPWCERQVRILNDAISTRKGLRRNLVIATRQFLNIGQSSYLNQSVVYTPDASEMQCRKLGDLAMCLGLYELASSSYDMARKDFLNDNAWLYYAGACEAYASARSMLKRFQKSHIEKAVSTYIDSCKSINLATRATIIATDITKKISPIDAAKFFVTLTGDDCDLRSALFLEQASRCYSLCPTKLRKAAFHHVLAGYRYSKCGLRKLSLRCYSKFQESRWEAAADHVDSSLRRIYSQLGIEAVNFAPLVEFSINFVSPKSENDLISMVYYTGETIELALKMSWVPTKLYLYSNNNLLTSDGILLGNTEPLILEDLSEVINFNVRVPQTPYKQVLYFKVSYPDKNGDMREAIKSIALNVEQCLSISSIIDHLISIKNVTNNHVDYCLVDKSSGGLYRPQQLVDKGPQTDPSMISNVPPNLTAHLLMKSPGADEYLSHPMIRWSVHEKTMTRHGVYLVEF